MKNARAVLACISLAGGCALSACGAATEAAVVPAAQVNTAPVGPARAVPARAVPARAVPAPAVLPRVSISRMEADGSLVTIATFRGPVRYALYDGGEDPYARPGLLRDQSAVAGSERRQLLAAFNGGFKMVADAGGYEQEGHLLYPLRPGLASLVISRAGKARIGVWGKSVPVSGEAVYSVRQNLQPLVLDGRPTAASSDWGLWGATLGGGEYVARSALGEAADGNLMYAGSMSATPYDLAYALARSGARSAMELDINPAWVQLDVARRLGGALHAKVYEQYRPADQYLYGWTRDFIAVFGDLRVLRLFPACADAWSRVARSPDAKAGAGLFTPGPAAAGLATAGLITAALTAAGPAAARLSAAGLIMAESLAICRRRAGTQCGMRLACTLPVPPVPGLRRGIRRGRRGPHRGGRMTVIFLGGDGGRLPGT
jgi:hypothetical protein